MLKTTSLVELLKRFPKFRSPELVSIDVEGFEEKAYDDSVGVRTVGYGTAATSGRAIPDEIPEEEASALAQEDLDKKG